MQWKMYRYLPSKDTHHCNTVEMNSSNEHDESESNHRPCTDIFAVTRSFQEMKVWELRKVPHLSWWYARDEKSINLSSSQSVTNQPWAKHGFHYLNETKSDIKLAYLWHLWFGYSIVYKLTSKPVPVRVIQTKPSQLSASDGNGLLTDERWWCDELLRKAESKNKASFRTVRLSLQLTTAPTYPECIRINHASQQQESRCCFTYEALNLWGEDYQKEWASIKKRNELMGSAWRCYCWSTFY